MIIRIPCRVLPVLFLAVFLPAAAPATAAQEETPVFRLEDADDALFDGDRARALEIYLALAESSDSGWTAGEASLAAAKLYASGRGLAKKDPVQAARFFSTAFDRYFEAALEAQAAGAAGATALGKLETTLLALADRFATGEQVQEDFERAVDMELRVTDELSSGEAVLQLCIHYADATPEQARYLPGRDFIVNYVASLALAVTEERTEAESEPEAVPETEPESEPVPESVPEAEPEPATGIAEADRAAYLNNLGEMLRGGPDRAEDNLLEAKSQPFPVHYGQAVWAYERAAERCASGTAMYSLGVMHYRAMGFPEYWLDGADSAAVVFRKQRKRLEAAREWFRLAVVNGDPEGETWFVGVSDGLLDLIDAAPSDTALASAKQQILELLRADTGLSPEAVRPVTWAGIEAFQARAGP